MCDYFYRWIFWSYRNTFSLHIYVSYYIYSKSSILLSCVRDAAAAWLVSKFLHQPKLREVLDCASLPHISGVSDSI